MPFSPPEAQSEKQMTPSVIMLKQNQTHLAFLFQYDYLRSPLELHKSKAKNQEN